MRLSGPMSGFARQTPLYCLAVFHKPHRLRAVSKTCRLTRGYLTCSHTPNGNDGRLRDPSSRIDQVMWQSTISHTKTPASVLRRFNSPLPPPLGSRSIPTHIPPDFNVGHDSTNAVAADSQPSMDSFSFVRCGKLSEICLSSRQWCLFSVLEPIWSLEGVTSEPKRFDVGKAWKNSRQVGPKAAVFGSRGMPIDSIVGSCASDMDTARLCVSLPPSLDPKGLTYSQAGIYREQRR